MDRAFVKSDRAENAMARGRILMSRGGISAKIILTFLFCVVCSVAVYMALDAVCFYFVPVRFENEAMILTFVAALAVYFACNLLLMRIGLRAQKGRVELFDLGRGEGGSGFSAFVAMCLGFLTLAAVASFLYAYIELFSFYVARALGQAVNLLCVGLTGFTVLVAFIYFGTGLFFLPAVAERERKDVFGLVVSSFRAASGNRLEIVRFVFGFSVLTALSLLSLGVLFFVYVLPLYILSYGAFASEVLD